MKIPGRVLLFFITCTILLIGAAGYSAPKDHLIDLSGHNREFRVEGLAAERSLTTRSGIDLPIVFNPSSGRYPNRDFGQGNLRWTASDANGISDQVAISDNGNIVAIGYSLNDERLEVRNAFGGDTLFTFRVESGASYVALSATGGIIAYAASDSLRLFRSNGRGVPFRRFGMEGYYPGPIALSLDGSLLIATANDPQGIVNRAWGIDTDNGQTLWTLDVDAQEAYNWYGAKISADGSLAVVNGKYRLFVIDARDGDLIFEEPTYNTESAVELSADGSILVTGSLSGRLRVFGRVEQTYEELWHYTFSGASSSWVTSVAISRDGRTTAAGTLDFFNDHYAGRYAVFDTYGVGVPLWISNSLADEVSGIAMNDDGGVIAFVTWGDINHEQPDLFVHERHNRAPFYTLTTNGSLAGVGISDNGSRVVAGGKGTHNRVFGRGGQAHLAELTLLGGFASGQVRNQRNQGIPGVMVGVVGGIYTALTDNNGRYILRVETNQPDDFSLYANLRGVGYNEVGARIVPGDTTENVNFQLRDGLVGDPPVNLRAAQGQEQNAIVLSWQAYNERALLPESSIRSAIGDAPEAVGVTPWNDRAFSPPNRDESDDAIEINIYRSPVSGGPYSLIGSVDGFDDAYMDRSAIFPQRRYYYRITATFEFGESAFSDEAVGWLDDDFLIWDANLQSMPRVPRLDGVMDEEEWAGAAYRDISDVFGYDAPDSAGTVSAWIGFSDQSDSLYLAVRYHSIDELEENMGLGVYVDDDADGKWSVRRPGSEGNYWGYWRNGAPDMRFRSLSGAPYASDPYYIFQNPTLAFSDDGEGVQVEMSIPLGFHSEQEVAVFAPDKTIGLGLFAMQRDGEGNPVFNGWWPQNMLSIVSEPWQFARVHIPVELTVPPLAPSALEVFRDDEGILVTWRDPEISMDSAAIGDWSGVNIYRNGEYLTSVDPGREAHSDMEFSPDGGDWGGWFDYSLAGYVLDDDGVQEGPRSQVVGTYLGVEPQIDEMRFDDGTPEAFYVVAFNGEDNRFATKFTLEAGPEEISAFWIDFYHRGSQPIDIWCVSDENGLPGIDGERFRVTPSQEEGITRFHFPRREQPNFALDPDWGGSFWVILNYLPQSPGAPAIGVDGSVTDGDRNLYYTTQAGWIPFELGQPIIRAGVGQQVNGINPEEELSPLRFEVLSNYPNPFNSRTFLPVRLPGSSLVELSLSDFNGRVVYRSKFSGLSAGEHIISIEANYLSSGIYLAKVKYDGEERRQAVHLIK